VRFGSVTEIQIVFRLLHLGVLGFGLFENRDVCVSLLPEGQKIPVGSACLFFENSSSVPLRLGSLERVGSGKAKMGEGSDRHIHDDPPVVKNFLELRHCFSSSAGA
jgi:hypothetical protein